jgi:GNAT superfamily N-acetyltransferase
MRPDEIARQLKAIRQKELDCVPYDSRIQVQIESAIVTLDPPSATSPYPSANRNGVCFFGCGGRVSRTDLSEILSIFRDSEVQRFFFWLSPNPQEEVITGWLEDNRFKPFKGTTYPTLIRHVEPVASFRTCLDVRRVSRGEVEENRDAVVRIFEPWPSSFFFESIEKSGFEHFMAYEAGAPVSAAILACDGDFAYLGWAGTAEAHRKKGGQNALIRARLNRAEELGCRVACSETLAMLKTSLRNLQRNGFETVYHKKVYVWES